MISMIESPGKNVSVKDLRLYLSEIKIEVLCIIQLSLVAKCAIYTCFHFMHMPSHTSCAPYVQHNVLYTSSYCRMPYTHSVLIDIAQKFFFLSLEIVYRCELFEKRLAKCVFFSFWQYVTGKTWQKREFEFGQKQFIFPCRWL